MKITAISDLHGHFPELPGGDLLLLCGDYTSNDSMPAWGEFFSWLKKQSYRKKILIAGNHDNFMMSGWPKDQNEADDLKEVQSFLVEQKECEAPDFEYLSDSGTEFEGLKIWGSPWTLAFHGMNPACMAFTRKHESELFDKFKSIPTGVDILITHSPPWGIEDVVADPVEMKSLNCGSIALRNNVLNYTKPKYHFFGHIHSCGGHISEMKGIIFANCAYVDEGYKPINKIINLEI